jgi:hypothetical protein
MPLKALIQLKLNTQRSGNSLKEFFCEREKLLIDNIPTRFARHHTHNWLGEDYTHATVHPTDGPI